MKFFRLGFLWTGFVVWCAIIIASAIVVGLLLAFPPS